MKKLYLLLISFLIVASNAFAQYTLQEIKSDREFISYPVFTVEGNKALERKANKEIADVVKETRAALLKDPDFYKSVSLDADVVNEGESYLSFVLYPGSYTGGAHPNYASLAYTYDKKTGKRLTAAYFSPTINRKSLFDGIVTGKMKVYTSDRETVLQPDQLLLNDIKFLNPNWDNVIVDNKGKPFLVFSTYALAPYACGTTYVELK